MHHGKSPRARLARISLPEFGTSAVEPELDRDSFESRYRAFMTRLGRADADIGIVYADREHGANLAWLSGFDPRFEEALLIASPGKDPILLTGPENQGVAKAAPLDMDVRLYPPLGLLGQDRSDTPELNDILSDAGIKTGSVVGVCGWKYYSPLEHAEYWNWIEIPAYIVDTLRDLAGPSGKIYNAGAIFMNPENGLRAINGIDELARFEFAACHTSEAVKRVIKTCRPEMREYEAARSFEPVGMPLSCHTMFSTGPRAWHGLLSPSSRKMKKGDAVTAAYGVQGALNCRAGWLAEDASDLAPGVQDYIAILVAPYFEAIAQWLQTIEIGITGGTLDAIIRQRLGDEFFGVKLNPGHLIHLDEWMHTPISPKSAIKLRSGMALQVDVIPGTGGPYFTNIEDGIALLDERSRAEFFERYPSAGERIHQRRAFMEDELGIVLKPDCLPFSNISGWLPPFWLASEHAMTMR